MRMKILYAVWTLPSPTLHGTIQMDIEHLIGDHMEGIAFICSDDDKTYRKAIRSLSLPHYICPSTRLSVLQEALCRRKR